MTGDEYRAALRALGMTQTAAGEWLAGHGVTGRKWALGGPPSSVAKMLSLMVALGVTREWVDSKIASAKGP